jgi:hypothetical protein
MKCKVAICFLLLININIFARDETQRITTRIINIIVADLFSAIPIYLEILD